MRSLSLWDNSYPRDVNDVQNWLEKLQRWIRSLFRPKKKRRTSPKILARWDRNFTVVLLLERNTPGGIATYRINSLYANCDYLITLDYLSGLHSELVGEFDGTPIRLGRIDYPRSPNTHRFAVFRIERNGNNRPICIYDVDLEGFRQNSSQRALAPKLATRDVALRSLQITHFTESESPNMTWEAQMSRMHWLGVLEERIRFRMDNPKHNLRTCVIYQEQA